MNKKEAAKFLEISEKTLERLVQRGKLSANMQKGKTRDVVMFDDAELAKFKEQRDSGTHIPAIMQPEDLEQSQSLILGIRTNLDNQDRQNETRQNDVMEYVNALSRQTEATAALAEAQVMSVLLTKPVLTVKEAVIITGRGEKFLRDAIKAEKLSAFIGLRGATYIYRTELDRFNNLDSKRSLFILDAAELSGLTPDDIEKAVNSGLLKTTPMGTYSKIMRKDLDRFMAKHIVKS